MAIRKKKTYNLQRLIKGALRKIWFYSPVRRQALKNAKEGNPPGLNTCAKCRTKVTDEHVQVDHNSPVITPDTHKTTWDVAIDRLFDIHNHQVLCKPCHKTKTQAENAIRKETRNGMKK